ncbi:caspase family protein [Dactylosporangium sp. NPDC005555]|uniref:caspase family protein n=1 Tax=Dactylosporangium sp. NPDC005555 TaxID=3154889 RepID=UPI0033A214AC
MARKALLIGSQTNGLTGVGNDVDSIAGALTGRGFDIRRCEGAEATRAGIFAAYDKLIADTAADDSVFVYYSGHGGRLLPPEGSSAVSQPTQFIVPYDLDDSTEGDFRGITSEELSARLDLLTDRTGNAAVMLDCCHSGHMSRDPDLRVKALHYTYDWIVAHHGREIAAGRLQPGRVRSLGNRNAVRLVACAPEQFAYEHTGRSGQRTGMFTESFVLALAEAGELPVTWAALMDRVHRRVTTLMVGQRPEVEGPARRLLFDTREETGLGALRVVPGHVADRVSIAVAPLLGVRAGDEFALMPPAAEAADAATMIGTATVDRVGAVAAGAAVAFRPGVTAVPLGTRAFCTRASAPALPVRLPAPTPQTAAVFAALEAEIAASTLVRAATDTDEDVVAEVIADGGGLAVCDRAGPLHPPRPAAAGTAAALRADLERVARATALRGLRDDPAYRLTTPVTVEWGLVGADRTEHPLRAAGEVLHPGQRTYVRIRNDGDTVVYASLIDIGVAAKVTLLTRFAPAGFRLEPGKEYVFGHDQLEDVLTGMPLKWPEGLPGQLARPETLIALVCDAPQNLGVIEQEGVDAKPGPSRRPGSVLERLVRQVAVGGSRDYLADTGPEVRYMVRTIDFDVVDAPAPTAEDVAFEIDDRPDPSARLFTPRGLAPRAVAVRLGELVVHKNRAVFGADIRVDAVVLTGGNPGGIPVHTAQTERFANIKDGDRLPLEQMLVYHGPAVDFLDIAVWVSRDSAGSLALSDLLRQQLTGQEVQAAGVQLASLAVAAPQAALAVGAVGAGAVLVNVAYQLLRGAVGDSIGLYRTSLLAHEEFGVGRYPADGTLRRAQDFSFSFTVQAVS